MKVAEEPEQSNKAWAAYIDPARCSPSPSCPRDQVSPLHILSMASSELEELRAKAEIERRDGLCKQGWQGLVRS